ncbi:TetR/AcrR family transcriptional regulator [Sulfidibacter corallicola]|uniref:TetR/AcrR family transcriptional regulator n=1 Tax=Sulfidibacter corallicola TaxID=2818388 RepID=A0A8A4TVV7_SULCO|nr:TetR/AcrR family transcriptional regulator [Sulfidibacter corallicola]QTD50665.1 TetR/AcrR family transcriptional regulator [Sulfidibacter corallicola]
MVPAKKSELTRAKIIDAAGRLFAERGFKGVTVRDIAKHADTHLSALNYHFQSKDMLYREVLAFAAEGASISESDQRDLRRLKPRQALFIMIKESLREYRDDAVDTWQNALLNRAAWEGSEAFDEVVERYYRPDAAFASEIVAAATDQPVGSEYVGFAVFTMVALLETFGLYGHLTEATLPGFNQAFAKKDKLAKHITTLVLAAANPSLEA